MRSMCPLDDQDLPEAVVGSLADRMAEDDMTGRRDDGDTILHMRAGQGPLQSDVEGPWLAEGNCNRGNDYIGDYVGVVARDVRWEGQATHVVAGRRQDCYSKPQLVLPPLLSLP